MPPRSLHSRKSCFGSGLVLFEWPSFSVYPLRLQLQLHRFYYLASLIPLSPAPYCTCSDIAFQAASNIFCAATRRSPRVDYGFAGSSCKSYHGVFLDPGMSMLSGCATPCGPELKASHGAMGRGFCEHELGVPLYIFEYGRVSEGPIPAIFGIIG